ncbi:MAG: aminoacyl-tRNA hydrolase [Lachnospiraceae bacterium]|nr:aminoacyl-tRNA hydrolase [Lachnospiraceae bacterium]
MKAIIGLGNPGRDYAGTRHNIGFDTITALCDKYGLKLSEKKFKGLCADGLIEGQRVILIQPQTFMNLSGECVRSVADFYKLNPDEILIICDDINLDVGRIRIRKKGSAGGHNGLKNIIAHLGTDEFPRIRVGVGEKIEGQDLVSHVLGRFGNDDEEIIRDVLKTARDAAAAWLTDGTDAIMNRYNTPRNKEQRKQE